MKQIKKILSKILEIKEDSITEETSKENAEKWDSFNSLMIISEIEAAFNVKFSMQEAAGIKCVKDIKNILKKHGIRLDE